MMLEVIVRAFALVTLLAAHPHMSSAGHSLQGPLRVDQNQPAILVLAIDDLTRPWIQLLSEGIRAAVADADPAVTVYQEFLDSARFDDASYTEGLRDWLRRKYAGRRIDLVVVPGQEGVEFLSRGRGEPWPKVPVMYGEVGQLTVDISKTLPGATGVIFESTLPSAVRVIKMILPNANHVAFVYGASTLERARFSGFPAGLTAIDPSLQPIDLGGLTTDDLLQRVARLPADTVVLNLSVQVDAAGRKLAPSEPCRLLSPASNAPLFSMGLQEFGCGIVGGLLRDFRLMGRMLGEQALEQVTGHTVETTIVPLARYTTLLFDARQLERWGIDERRLPAGSTVAFRQPSLWRDYRREVLGAMTIGSVLALLLAGLIWERRRRLLAELEARKQLVNMAHLDRRVAMGELATSLAHEINQPLNAILQNAGVARMLLSRVVNETTQSELAAIVDDIRSDDLRASEVIRRMRGLLQKHELETRPVNVYQLAKDTVALVNPDAKSRDIQVELKQAEDVPIVLGDKVHLQQVLLNLLLNGMDAVSKMPADRRRVFVRTVHRNGVVELSVKDSGTGIPEDRVSRIFEPFYTTKGEGMGMGLAIARSIVDAHAGQMAAENNAEGGATVWFSVPVGPGTPS
jgi:signal transduction histidine kinase